MIIHKKKKKGRGLVNKLINKLPIELHLPGYQYYGPGTKLAKRLARGDPGINLLDSACKEHDIAYSQNRENLEARHAADQVLANKAWERVFSKDAGVGERAAAYAVTNAMNLKTKLRQGLRKKKTGRKSRKRKSVKKKSIKKKSVKRKSIKRKSTKKKKKKASTPLSKIIKAAKSSSSGNCAKKTISSAIKNAREAIKKAGGRSFIKIPRILPVSQKIGGFLPYLIPLFAGLSATGALAGGAAGVAKAINQAKASKDQLEESRRHNKSMEAIALGKGLYLKPYKAGYGLYLKPYSGGR